MIGASGHTDAGRQVEFPVGTQVQVQGRHDGLLLVAQRTEAGDGAHRAIVFKSHGDLLGDVVAYFGAWRKGDALAHVQTVKGALQRGVDGHVPAVQLLVDDGPDLPRPGVGGVASALVTNFGRQAHIHWPVPRFGDPDAWPNVIAYPLVAFPRAVAHE